MHKCTKDTIAFGNLLTSQNTESFFLLMGVGLSTRNILRRRNMHLDSYTYVLYSTNIEETLEYRFLDCTFARACWNLLDINLLSNIDVQRRLQIIKHRLKSPFFMNASLMCRTIWSARNDLIFKRIQANIQAWKQG
jgi:hypothetical protein